MRDNRAMHERHETRARGRCTRELDDRERFRIAADGDDLVLRVAGPIDIAGCSELRTRIAVMARSAGEGRFVADLTAVGAVASCVVGALRAADHACRAARVELVVRAPVDRLPVLRTCVTPEGRVVAEPKVPGPRS
jgi:anti-anti-sigma regulatory factor